MASAKQGFALLVLVCLCTAPAQADIYRVVAPDGSVTYTDTKPPETTPNVDEIDLPEVRNSNDTRAITRAYDRLLKAEQLERNKALKKAKSRQKKLAPKLLALEKAKQALAQGQDKRGGDYVRNANGGTRLSPAYYQRIAQLEAAVEAAETALAKARFN